MKVAIVVCELMYLKWNAGTLKALDRRDCAHCTPILQHQSQFGGTEPCIQLAQGLGPVIEKRRKHNNPLDLRTSERAAALLDQWLLQGVEELNICG